MADEKPVTIKKKKLSRTIDRGSGGRQCIIRISAYSKESTVGLSSETSFASIQNARDTRQEQDKISERLDDVCKTIPEVFDAERHGVHRSCYKFFTNVSKMKKRKAVSASECARETNVRSSARVLSSTSVESRLFAQDQCLFCQMKRKQRKGATESLVKCVTTVAEGSIKMIAHEALYHESCRKAYIRRDNRQHHSIHEDSDARCGGRDQRSAYDQAFNYLTDYVSEHI